MTKKKHRFAHSPEIDHWLQHTIENWVQTYKTKTNSPHCPKASKVTFAKGCMR